MAESQAPTVRVSRVIDASREVIFEALTNAAVLERWFFAGGEGFSAKVTNDLRVGGAFSVDMIGPDKTYRHHGEYTEIVPPERIAFTSNSEAVQNTLVTIVLAEQDGGTLVSMTHEMIPDGPNQEAHESGWEMAFDNLELALATN